MKEETNVRIPRSLMDRVQTIAARLDRSAASWIRSVLTGAVEVEEAKHRRFVDLHWLPATVAVDGGTREVPGARVTLYEGHGEDAEREMEETLIPREDGMPSMDAWAGVLAFYDPPCDWDEWVAVLERIAASGAAGGCGQIELPRRRPK